MLSLRSLARPLLASMFVAGGVDALLNAKKKVPAAKPVTDEIGDYVEPVRNASTEQLVQANAVVQIAAGSLLAIGRLPRASSAVLAGSLIPTTAAGHRFWEVEDPVERANQRAHFLKNASMLGGLAIAAMDTEGEPGLAWRASNAVDRASNAVERTKRDAELAKRAAGAQVKTAGKLAKAQAKLIKAEAKNAMKGDANTRAQLVAAQAKLAKSEAKAATMGVGIDARTQAKLAKQRAKLEARHAVDHGSTFVELAKERLAPDVADLWRGVSALVSSNGTTEPKSIFAKS